VTSYATGNAQAMLGASKKHAQALQDFYQNFKNSKKSDKNAWSYAWAMLQA
jgi:hypothetical protein